MRLIYSIIALLIASNVSVLFADTYEQKLYANYCDATGHERTEAIIHLGLYYRDFPDSLNKYIKELSTTQDVSAICYSHCLNSIRESIYGSRTESERFLKYAESTADSSGHDFKAALLKYTYAMSLHFSGENERAFDEFLNSAMDFYNLRELDLYANCEISMATILLYYGSFAEASERIDIADSVGRKLNDENALYLCILKRTIVSYGLGNIDGMRIPEYNNKFDNSKLASLYYNVAGYKFFGSDDIKAGIYFHSQLKSALNAPDSASALVELGNIEYNKSNFAGAIYYYKLGLDCAGHTFNRLYTAYALKLISEYYSDELEDYPTAIKYLDSSMCVNILCGRVLEALKECFVLSDFAILINNKELIAYYSRKQKDIGYLLQSQSAKTVARFRTELNGLNKYIAAIEASERDHVIEIRQMIFILVGVVLIFAIVSVAYFYGRKQKLLAKNNYSNFLGSISDTGIDDEIDLLNAEIDSDNNARLIDKREISSEPRREGALRRLLNN